MKIRSVRYVRMTNGSKNHAVMDWFALVQIVEYRRNVMTMRPNVMVKFAWFVKKENGRMTPVKVKKYVRGPGNAL